MGVPEVLDQLCRDLIHSIIIVVHPDFHQVFPVCDVPLGPKLRYSVGRAARLSSSPNLTPFDSFPPGRVGSFDHGETQMG